MWSSGTGTGTANDVEAPLQQAPMAGRSHRPDSARSDLAQPRPPRMYIDVSSPASLFLLALQFSLFAIELSTKQVHPDVLYEP